MAQNAYRRSPVASSPPLPVPLAIIHDLIRLGRFAKAKSALQEFRTRKVPRELLVTLASFARRLELPEWGLQWLYPIIRPGKMAVAGGPATPREIAEYAGNLIRLGAHREALELLSRRDLEKLPDTLLFQAFARIGMWDYAGAIPYLEKFLMRAEIDPYQAAVANTNLAIALVFERRFDEANPVLTELETLCKTHRYQLLYANARKVRAQAAIEKGEGKAADAFLSESEKLMRESGRWDHLFLAKWRAVRHMADKASEAVKAIERVRADAVKTGHWETARDCEGRLAVATHSPTRLWHVYFGTPYPSFREKLLREFRFVGSPPAQYLRTDKKSGKLLDLTAGADRGPALAVGDIRYRLLLTLSSDFFRPFRVGALFQILFPEEHFNPTTSPSRVRMAVMRLKRALAQRGYPGKIERGEEGYRFIPGGPVKMELGFLVLKRTEGVLERARVHFGEKTFSAQEGATALDVSVRNFSRTLQMAESAGEVVREGKGRATRYRFNQP